MKTKETSLITVIFFLFAFTVITLTSCSKAEDNGDSQREQKLPYIKVEQTNISVYAYTQDFEQDIETNIADAENAFEVSSSEKWCSAKVLYRPCRLQLTFDQNESINQREAVVTLKAVKFSLTVSIHVIQLALRPILEFANDEEKFQRLEPPSKSWTWTLRSNLPYDELVAESNVDWCQVNLTGDEEGTGMKNYQLTTSVSDNMSAQRRSATVTISAKNHNTSTSFSITQNGSTLIVYERNLAFDREGGSRQITVTSDAAWQAECDADWITLEQTRGSLTIGSTGSNEDRTATIMFKDRESPSITIHQSKYKTGDAYDENGVTGTVGYIGDEKRFIFQRIDEELAYRQYDDAGLDGTGNKDDGMANTMTALKIVINKGKSYPAFQTANRLNTGGASGWYLPAINELELMKEFITDTVWSSTEAYVLSAYTHNGSSTQIINKTKKLKVYAIRKY